MDVKVAIIDLLTMPADPSLEKLFQLLRDDSDARFTLSLATIFRFVTYAARLKDDILLPQPAHHSHSVAPDLLPSSVLQFLASACQISTNTAENCWNILKETIWNSIDFSPEGNNFDACAKEFLTHGHAFGICKCY